MIRPKLLSFFLLLIFGVTDFELVGQVNCSELGRKDRDKLARSKVSELGADSVLAIRLQGYQKQLEELDKLIDAASNPKSLARLIKKRDKYQSSCARWLRHLQTAFAKYYNQSRVVFYLDHDQAFVDDENAGIWLNADGSTGKMERFSSPKFFLVQSSTSNQGLEAFILKDESFLGVCSPLPAYFKMNSFSTFFLTGEREEVRKAENLARSVQSKISELRSL